MFGLRTIDGRDLFAATCARRASKSPFLMLTGTTSDADTIMGWIAAQIDFYVTKPCQKFPRFYCCAAIAPSCGSTEKQSEEGDFSAWSLITVQGPSAKI